MKPKSLVFPGSYTTYFADGTTRRTSLNAGEFVLTCVPSSGINPGDGRTPTNWSYTLRSERFFTLRYSMLSGCKSGYPYTLGVRYNGSGRVNPPVNWDRSRLYNQALASLNEKARNSADWSEDIARLGQVGKLLNVIDTATDLMKTAKRNPLGIPKAIAQGYLQFRYGWQPMLQNIYDSAIVVAEAAIDKGFPIRASATESIKVSRKVENMGGFSYSSSAKPPLYPYNHTESGKQGCRLHVNLAAQSSKVPTIADFTTLNPALLAWNLIPFSFVADWFYNIGGYMEAYETAFRMRTRFVSGYMSELYVNYTKESASQFCGGYNQEEKIENALASRRDVRFTRTVLTSYPLPTRPSLKLDLGSSRLLAAAALLTNFVGNKPSFRRTPR